MFANSVLVTGSNRGIGLELITQLVGKTQHLFAACRNPDQADELQKLAKAHKHVLILKLDVTQEEEIASAVETITAVVGENGLNCIINNAGVNHKDNHESMNAEVLKHVYAVNAVGPAMIIKSCLPLLRQASSSSSDDSTVVSRASILNISSIRGSITGNDSGRNYAYRMSKAAMNMLTMNLSIELKKDNIFVVSINPGWVQTKIGGPNALIDTTKSVEGIFNVVANFTVKNNGMFYDWNGEKIPW